MNIKTVRRKDIRIPKTRNSKYAPLVKAIKKLEPEGKAMQVKFKNKSELNCMRNIVYSYNRKHKVNIRSSKHPQKNVVFFYMEEGDDRPEFMRKN